MRMEADAGMPGYSVLHNRPKITKVDKLELSGLCVFVGQNEEKKHHITILDVMTYDDALW